MREIGRNARRRDQTSLFCSAIDTAGGLYLPRFLHVSSNTFTATRTVRMSVNCWTRGTDEMTTHDTNTMSSLTRRLSIACDLAATSSPTSRFGSTRLNGLFEQYCCTESQGWI